MQLFLQVLKTELEKMFSFYISNMTVKVSDVDMKVSRCSCAPLRINIRYGCMVIGVDVCEENGNRQSRKAVVSFFVRSVPNPFLDSSCEPQQDGVWRDIENQNVHQYTVQKFKDGFRLCKSYDKATSVVGVAKEIFEISQMLGRIS